MILKLLVWDAVPLQEKAIIFDTELIRHDVLRCKNLSDDQAEELLLVDKKILIFKPENDERHVVHVYFDEKPDLESFRKFKLLREEELLQVSSGSIAFDVVDNFRSFFSDPEMNPISNDRCATVSPGRYEAKFYSARVDINRREIALNKSLGRLPYKLHLFMQALMARLGEFVGSSVYLLLGMALIAFFKPVFWYVAGATLGLVVLALISAFILMRVSYLNNQEAKYNEVYSNFPNIVIVFNRHDSIQKPDFSDNSISVQE